MNLVLELETVKADITSVRFDNRYPYKWELSKAESQADRLLYMLDRAEEALEKAIDRIKELEAQS